jgi:NAD(P)-dependent dehydrogenase (short-subunit alcohol dehydrogenase family)
MANALEGKVAVITGSGRGIGRSCAELFAQEGCRVVVNDFGVDVDGRTPRSDPADETVATIKQAGGDAIANYDSVATVEGGERMVKQSLDTWGRLDIVVHVAGILRDRMIFNMTEEEWDSVIAVHLKGYFAISKPASILFRQQRGGRIIGFSSGSGLRGNSGQANYGAAKAGIAGMTRVMAKDLGRYGVTVNSISPSANTRMVQSVPDSAREARAARGISGAAQALASRPANPPEQVAGMVAYLASDQAWNINGQVFAVAGGAVSLLYHPTPYRTIFKDELWTVEDLARLVPQQLMAGVENPAPPADPTAAPASAPAR